MPKVDRRNFLRILTFAGAVGALGAYVVPIAKYIKPPSQTGGEMPKSLLVDENGNPLKASELPVNKMYLFNYPLKNVPNLLINVGDKNGNPVEVKPIELPISMHPLNEPALIFGGKKDPKTAAAENTQFYKFPGGTGPNKSIVAYNTICQHLGCLYPQLRFFPPGTKTDFNTNPPIIGQNGGVLFCRCHGSAYDPYRGAIVLSEPALKPLPTIVLEWDETTDYLYAVDVIGPVIFGRQCDTCGGELVGDKVVAKPV